MKGVFILSSLITLALTVRSQHGLESAVIWWIHFFPSCAMLYVSGLGYSAKAVMYRFYYIWPYSIGTYLAFHPWHFKQVKDWQIFENAEFWPLSIISLIIVTYLTITELKR